ncbi:MAG TPA: spore cortex biosynthesis protein YabQ [Oscillospiraceae bacterium]|nr:spore cortex biosynthesis protein YabQ [Oscillospiraceae bacterium]
MQASFVTEQLITLAVTCGLGIVIGIGFDALSVLQQFMLLSKTAQFVIDLLYCLLMTVFVFIVLVLNSWGEVRAYTFFAMGAGGLFYYLFCHRFCRRQMVRGVEVFIAVARFIGKPFIWSTRHLTRLVRSLSQLLKTVVQAGRHRWQKIKLKIHNKKKE